jgi:hypothetical protein
LFICSRGSFGYLSGAIHQENEGFIDMVFCSVCFGDPTSPLTQWYNYAVFALLAVVIAVLSGFGILFLNFRKRAKTHLDN